MMKTSFRDELISMRNTDNNNANDEILKVKKKFVDYYVSEKCEEIKDAFREQIASKNSDEKELCVSTAIDMGEITLYEQDGYITTDSKFHDYDDRVKHELKEAYDAFMNLPIDKRRDAEPFFSYDYNSGRGYQINPRLIVKNALNHKTIKTTKLFFFHIYMHKVVLQLDSSTCEFLRKLRAGLSKDDIELVSCTFQRYGGNKTNREYKFVAFDEEYSRTIINERRHAGTFKGELFIECKIKL